MATWKRSRRLSHSSTSSTSSLVSLSVLDTFQNKREKTNGFEFLQAFPDKEKPVKDKRDHLGDSYLSGVGKGEHKPKPHPSTKDDDHHPGPKSGALNVTGRAGEGDKSSPKANPPVTDGKDHKPNVRVDPATLVNHLNKALREMYHTNEVDFENYAEENYLKKGSVGTLLKMMQYKLVSHLILEKVKIRDLSWVCLYRLFKKHSQEDKKFNSVRTLNHEQYMAFLKDLEVMMSPFVEIHSQIGRDISRMKEFESDSNLMDDQYVFAHYIRNTQK
jgi:hypothetical protein